LLGYFGRTSLFILIFHAPILYWILRNLPKWLDSPLWVGIAAFVMPIVLSLAVYYICRRSALLSVLMFPLKPKRVERRLSAAPR
jgi:xanthine/uracil/vitamin C permease (AzgA family)